MSGWSGLRTEEARDNSRRASRVAKRRRKGRCEDCGTTTRYNGHGTAVSRFCHSCAAARTGEQLKGTGPTQRRILAALSSGPMRFTALKFATGLDNNNMGAQLDRLLKHGLIVRLQRGVYALAQGDSEGSPEPAIGEASSAVQQ